MFRLFEKNRPRNIAVVDFGTESVGAAYATISGVAPPAIVFRSRVHNTSESLESPGALRALDLVARDMSLKGAPLLHKMTGRGSVDQVYVLISAPVQTTTLVVKTIEKGKPFVITESMLQEATKEAATEGAHISLITSVLNGYDVAHPVGRKASKAEIVFVSSAYDPEIEPYIRRAVRSFVGASPIEYVSFPSMAHAVLRGLFPLQHDFLAIRVGTESTELACVRQGHLAGVERAEEGAFAFKKAARDSGIVMTGVESTGEHGLIDPEKNARLASRLKETEDVWIGAVREALLRLASSGALPRVVFLLSEETSVSFFKRLLDSPHLHDLWLSDEPLTIIPILPRHFFPFMRHVDVEGDDAVLDMISLIARVPTS